MKNFHKSILRPNRPTDRDVTSSVLLQLHCTGTESRGLPEEVVGDREGQEGQGALEEAEGKREVLVLLLLLLPLRDSFVGLVAELACGILVGAAGCPCRRRSVARERPS